MYAASGAVAGFIAAHPTTKTLALAFLMLIGVALVADGFDFHIPRGYVYFAMAFAAVIEMFNIVTARRRRRYRTPTGPDAVAGPLPAPPPQSPDQVRGGEAEG
jgi:predicted tellurium resistance membrane protein TerC